MIRINPMVLKLHTKNAFAYFHVEMFGKGIEFTALISTVCSKAPAFPSPSKSGLTQQYCLNNNPV